MQICSNGYKVTTNTLSMLLMVLLNRLMIINGLLTDEEQLIDAFGY